MSAFGRFQTAKARRISLVPPHHPSRKPQQDKRILLHFGAADQTAEVFVNRISAVRHCGGYLPFSADITDYLQEGDNELIVRIQDESNTSWHARGKQSLKPGGMFYTAQSGLWQTVWMEIVPVNYIEQIFITPTMIRDSST